MELNKFELSDLEEIILSFMIYLGFSACTVDIKKEFDNDLQYHCIYITNELNNKKMKIMSWTLDKVFLGIDFLLDEFK